MGHPRARKLTFNNRVCIPEKETFYVKKGPFTHAYVTGWQLNDYETGEVVISGDPGRARDASEFQNPKFPTLKSLLEYISKGGAK